ncbi:MAG: hypothetical protein II008_03755 [Oscillospiraceae bacterium]|nr:hypothetical protein [Oscillospiraceae bacterium]
MSVLIQGMGMPESCSVCKLSMTTERYEIVCKPLNCYASDADRETECPLIEIPPHGRLIDVDKDPSDYITVWDCDCSEFGKQTVMAVDDLRYLPTIIPADKEDRR